MVAGINRTNNNVEIIYSDGFYCLKSILKKSNDPYSNDDKFLALIDSKKIFPG